MFEAIGYTTPTVNGGEIASFKVVPLTAPEKTNEPQLVELPKLSGTDPAARKAENEEKEPGKDPQLTKRLLKELEQDIETIHSVGLQFSVHDKTGRTFVKITDKETHKLIREIPSEEVLNLAAKMEEMIGILFDKKV